jgi:hypothetical protein
MKVAALIASFLFASFFASPALGDDSEEHKGVRAEYDDLMRTSGEWKFVAKSTLILGLAGAGYSYYAYSRYEGYLNLAKTRTLTPHEEDQEKLWQDACNDVGIGSGAFLAISLGAYIGEVHYELRAHAFALDMGVKF